jgi:hypothetical protein
MCDFGKVKCTEQLCQKNPPCPWGYKLKYVPGKCCPECVGGMNVGMKFCNRMQEIARIPLE